MRDVLGQLYREADQVWARRGPGFHVDQVHVSPAVFRAFDQWVTEESVHVGRPATGVIQYGRFQFRSMDSLEGGTALLSGPKGVLAAVELKLDPRYVVSAPPATLHWSKAQDPTHFGVDLASGPDATVIQPMFSKKVVRTATAHDAAYGALVADHSLFADHVAALNKKMWDDLYQAVAVGQIATGQITAGSIVSDGQRPALLEPLPVRQQAEGIIAYRKWDLVEVEGEWRLRSVTADHVWDGPILRADAEPLDQQPPTSGGHTGHGIYACKEKVRVAPAPPYWDDFDFDQPEVAGEVELRGRVVVHEHGYRAERARILSLTLPPVPRPFAYDPALIRSLEERYHCDVHIGGW